MKTTILKKTGLTILGMLVLFSQVTFAQEGFYTIKGKVKDSETKKASFSVTFQLQEPTLVL
ncbi:MAG: hypothetical protein HC831_01820 [Chloroflexia bacterium]|nr:hypothetical protein [Chloroflexia bacterium]